MDGLLCYDHSLMKVGVVFTSPAFATTIIPVKVIHVMDMVEIYLSV